ncbi:MAG: hypothetical protein PVH43_01385 [Desulfobacterales bacterium]
MHRRQFNIIIKSQAGLGYVAILMLLAVLSTMGLAFIYKVGLMSSITLNRRTSMQAHYLAESAANHALWHMLNDPEFAPASDKYYMHSLGDGRYGYKVRMPTETTFATVATVGAMGDIVTQQSYVQYIIPSNVLTAYARTTTPTIQYRRLIGAHWTDPADTPDIPVPAVYWVDMEGCPVRKEIIMGSIDGPDDINLVVWDGASWGNPHTFGQDANKNYKCFDIAYESQSGNALVVGRTDGTATVRYNVWDGTAWLHATAQPAFNLAGGTARLVVMAPCPGNDQILIATVNSLFDLQLFLWNGTAFTDLGVIETSTHNDQPGAVEIVYEQQSGDALVIWTIWSATPKFRVWNGVTLGPENIVPIFPDNIYFLRAAGDPTSDHIVVAGVDKFYDIQVGIWDGTAWPDSREVETDNANQVRQGVDVAWEATGEDALVVWTPWSSGVPILRSLAWRKGTALADSTVQEGPDALNQPWLARLHPISQSEKIVLLVENTSNDLRYSLWDGDRLKGDPAILLESDISVQNQLAFDLTEANVPRTGGTGSGIVTNQPPTVDAGLDETIYLPINQVDLDGTVTDDGLPNPPATVTTTWSVVSGPGTVNIDDSSSVDTVARFSEAGTYVLRLTADDSELSDFDEVTIIVDSCALLLVVADATSLSSDETNRKTTFEGWGWTVSVISDDALQSDFDAAVAVNDVAYVPVSVDGTILGTKLRGAVIGVVIEELMVGFGTLNGWNTKDRFEVDILDNSHYITSPFDLGLLTYLSSTQLVGLNTLSPAPGAINLAQTFNTGSLWDPSLIAYDTGGELYGGDFAAARRVQLPWGADTFDFNALNSDGKTIMKRAVEWAANKEGGCGGGNGPLLFVVPDASGPSTQDNDRKALMEGWGWTVTFISASATQAEFDAAVAINKVAYVMEQITPDDLNTKLRDAAIGVVNEQGYLVDEFGFSGNREWPTPTTTLDLTDNTHYITSPFGIGDLIIASSAAEVISMGGSMASGLQQLGMFPEVGQPGLGAIEIGGGLYGGGVAAGRRVQLPWGRIGFDINSLTDDGRTIMKRAIEWAASGGGGGGNDTDPPTPDPLTWASPPTADGPNSIRMTATTASDPSGVEYYFECTAGGGNDSGWQDSATYADTGLSPATSYTYRVEARDKSANQNETGWSAEASATTASNVMYVQDIAMGYRKHATKYWGQATVWIRSEDGTNISGAIVSGDWSGAVSGTSMGTTGSDGKVMLESPEKKDGGTFTFTVTNVTKAGYIYDSGQNEETSDSITAP